MDIYLEDMPWLSYKEKYSHQMMDLCSFSRGLPWLIKERPPKVIKVYLHTFWNVNFKDICCIRVLLLHGIQVPSHMRTFQTCGVYLNFTRNCHGINGLNKLRNQTHLFIHVADICIPSTSALFYNFA